MPWDINHYGNLEQQRLRAGYQRLITASLMCENSLQFFSVSWMASCAVWALQGLTWGHAMSTIAQAPIQKGLPWLNAPLLLSQNSFWTGNPTLSFCSGPCKLYGHSCSYDMKMARKQWTTLWSKCIVIYPYKRGYRITQRAPCLHNRTDPELKCLLFFLQAMTAMVAIGSS